MSAMVNGLMRKARNVGQDGSNDLEALEHLREAAKLILSRPDSDNMVAKLMPEIRKELQGYNSFEDSMSSLAAEAMSVARNDNAANTPRATAFVVLQNLLSQLRPEVGSNAELRRVVERIRDARLSVPSDVKKDLKLRGMVVLKNTSDLAKEILKTPFKPAEKKAPAAPADEE